MKIEIGKIIIGKRRKPNPERVKEIAASIDEIGQINPIVVCLEGNSQRAPAHLVAGLHRLEALKELGHDIVSCDVVLEDNAELVEIDENLLREDLTEIERAQCIKRKQTLLKSRCVSEKHTTRHPGSIRDVAENIGIDPTVVKKSLKRAEKIAPDVQDEIAEMPSADVGEELDALASLEPDEQRQAVERVKSGTDDNFRAARDFIKGESAEEEKHRKMIASLRRAWAKANDAVRAEFQEEIAGWKA
jgi:ParB family chromosome partitioning protein